MSWLVGWGGSTFSHMFVLTLPVAEKVLRPVIVYAFLVILLRVFGKRELAQLNPFDLVVLLSLSNTVQNAIIGDDTSLTGGLIGAFALCGFNYIVVRFLFKHRRLDQLLEGSPTVLIKHGRMRQEGLARELLNEHDLMSIARRQGFASFRDIETCVLEPGGTFSIEGKEPGRAESYHAELIAKLEHLDRQIEHLKHQLRNHR